MFVINKIIIIEARDIDDYEFDSDMTVFDFRNMNEYGILVDAQEVDEMVARLKDKFGDRLKIKKIEDDDYEERWGIL